LDFLDNQYKHYSPPQVVEVEAEAEEVEAEAEATQHM
jgi:hypothetical protein